VRLRLRPTDREFEVVYPWLGGLVAWALALAFLPPWFWTEGRQLVDPVINVAAIAVAFLIAVAVMLAPLKAEPVIRELQRIEAFPVMLGYLRSAIYAWGVVIIVGLLVKVVPDTAIFLGSVIARSPKLATVLPRLTWFGALLPLWIAALVAGTLAGHRIVRVLFAVLRYRDPRLVRPLPPSEEPQDNEALSLPTERHRRTAR